MNENPNFNATPVMIFLFIILIILCIMISQTPEMQGYELKDAVDFFHEVQSY